MEAGWGSYDSHNSFATGDVSGEGSSDYYGFGLFVRSEEAASERGYFYSEASLRFGRVDTDYNSANYLNVPTGYDSDAVYYGLHAGAGYINKLRGDATLDLYGKLLWTRQGSDTTTVTTGDRLSFGAANSIRGRVGARYSNGANKKTNFYAGLAYDYEFSGKQKAEINGLRIDQPSLKGGTGIGELGVVFKGKNSQVDLKVEGYTGKREGFGGGVQFKWVF